MNTKIFTILLLMLCITGCNNHRTKQYAQHKMRQVQKQETEKFIVPKDTCWIRIEDKKFFIGEDLDSVKKKIDIYPSPVGDWDKDYETVFNDLEIKNISGIKYIACRFENKQLVTMDYEITTSDTGLSKKEFNNFSEKNFREYYKFIDKMIKDNPCWLKTEYGKDSTKYKRHIRFMWGY